MKRVILSLVAVLILPGVIYAQGDWVSFTPSLPGAKPIIEVLESNNSRTVVHVTIPGMWVKDTLVNSTTYQILRIPDYRTMYNVGGPQLPAIGELVAIPPFSNVNITATSTALLVLNDYMVYPYQEPVPEGEPPGPFIIDTSLYSTNAFYPDHATELSDPAVWRDVRVVHSSLYPITFNPVTQQLNVRYDFTVKLDYSGVSNVNVLPGGYPAGLSPQRAAMYRSQIVNYNWLGIPEDNQYCSYDYLVITTSEFEDAIQPFVFWKHKKGFETRVEVVAAGLTPEAIKAVIEADYDKRKTEWVLLVGDAPDDIPIQYVEAPYYSLSDYWYALLTGNDDYPELAVGRFSPANATDVMTMVNKTFAYERTPCADWDIDEVLLVVCWDCFDSYACKQYIREYVMEPNNFTVDTAYAVDANHYATNDTVEHYIQEENGVNIVNYRGHGYAQGWGGAGYGWSSTNEYFTIYDVGNLNNGLRLPLVFSFCCHTGRITETDPECMVEAWTRNPDGGGVGALGATHTTYWEASNPMDTIMFETMFNPSLMPSNFATYDIGKVINYAKVYILPILFPKGIRTAYRHLWAGDPSLWVWTDSTGELATLTVTHPTCIGTEPTQFRVTVEDGAGGANAPVAYALVCLYKKETETLDLYERGFTDANGQIIFNICPATAGNLYVTVTKHHSNGDYYYNYKPYEGTCRVLWSPGGSMSGDYSSVVPRFFTLGQSYPNPFEQVTEIRYQIPETGVNPYVSLRIYDVTGRIVRTLVNETREPGYYRVLWNGKDNLDNAVPSGIYFYRIEAGNFTAMKKIVKTR